MEIEINNATDITNALLMLPPMPKAHPVPPEQYFLVQGLLIQAMRNLARAIKYSDGSPGDKAAVELAKVEELQARAQLAEYDLHNTVWRLEREREMAERVSSGLVIPGVKDKFRQ